MLSYLDKSDFGEGDLLSDICIVGAGAAGVTIANELVREKSQKKVILLESGSLHWEERNQDLYDGKTESLAYNLDKERLRFFGGTTNHWNGMCAMFEKHEFKERPWLGALAKWPVERRTLSDYYKRAAVYIDMPNYSNNVDISRIPSKQPQNFNFRRYTNSPPTRFAQKYLDTLKSKQNLHIILNANLKHIQLNADGNAVDHLKIVSLSGNAVAVKSKQYIIACGGIENPRLLLTANDVHKNGVGNNSGFVGSHFMEHPHFYTAANAFLFHHSIPTLVTNRHFQEKTLTLSASINLDVRTDKFNNITPEDRRALDYLSSLTFSAQKNAPIKADIVVRMEQHGNSNNWVRLSDEKDALGMPRVKLNWKIGDIEKRTLRESLKSLAGYLAEHNLGLIKNNSWLLAEDWSQEISPGSHHMGTTRMSANPKEGVVDINCKVHDVANLYIAGSSVFPTSGWANPTFTITALAIRLADHLKTLR